MSTQNKKIDKTEPVSEAKSVPKGKKYKGKVIEPFRIRNKFHKKDSVYETPDKTTFDYLISKNKIKRWQQ